MRRYLLRDELEARLTGFQLLSLGLGLTLLFSNLAWGGYQLLSPEPRLTELVMIKDGKDYVELYFGPEDCLEAGNDIEPGVYWRCETQ